MNYFFFLLLSFMSFPSRLLPLTGGWRRVRAAPAGPGRLHSSRGACPGRRRRGRRRTGGRRTAARRRRPRQRPARAVARAQQRRVDALGAVQRPAQRRRLRQRVGAQGPACAAPPPGPGAASHERSTPSATLVTLLYHSDTCGKEREHAELLLSGIFGFFFNSLRLFRRPSL